MELVNQKYTIDKAEELSYTVGVIPFWKPEGNGMGPHVLSQWYKCRFTDELGMIYQNAEQYMMVKKALLMSDIASSIKIMKETEPYKIKKLGREIKNFDEEKWNKWKYSIIYNGNLLKFGQNENLKKYLLQTGVFILCETSPYDKIYGIGISADNNNIDYPENWNGQNLLGFALMHVRDTLRKNC